MTESYEFAMLADAVLDAVEYGYTWPRRWLALYGGLSIQGHTRLNKQYRQHLAAIKQLVPKTIIRGRWQ